MVCVHCGAETQVVNSRLKKKVNKVWRRRRCVVCGSTFTTEEEAQYTSTWAVRGESGKLAPFSRDRLMLSLYKSCGHRKTAISDAGGLADTVIARLAPQARSGVLRSQLIQQAALVALNRFDKAASVHYQAHHT